METTTEVLDKIKKHIDAFSHEEYFSPTGALLIKAYAHLNANNIKEKQ